MSQGAAHRPYFPHLKGGGMEPVMQKLEEGWECQKCRFSCYGMQDALTHATREHGADAAWDSEGTIWDAKDPEVLRECGVL